MRIFKSLVLTLIILLFTGEVFGVKDTTYDINIKVQTFTLENGMLFLVVQMTEVLMWGIY